MISVLIVALVAASSGGSAEKFGDETAIDWSVEVERDGSRARYGGAQIDALPELSHEALQISCHIPLTRERVPYDPTGKRGYARQEERVTPTCRMGDAQLILETVTCAKSAARNKVGNVYGDAAQLRIVREPQIFELRVRCTLK